MAMQEVLLGGYVDEEVAKINANFDEIESDYAKQTDIPTVPTKTSDLTNDSNFVSTSDMTTAINNAVGEIDVPTKLSELQNDSNYVKSTDAAFINKVDKENGKGLSTNDYTNADKQKVDRIGKIDFTASNFGTQQTDGYYYATLSANGKYPVKVMRQNGSDYEDVLVHTKVSGTNIVIVSKETFAGYVVTI